MGKFLDSKRRLFLILTISADIALVLFSSYLIPRTSTPLYEPLYFVLAGGIFFAINIAYLYLASSK